MNKSSFLYNGLLREGLCSFQVLLYSRRVHCLVIFSLTLLLLVLLIVISTNNALQWKSKLKQT